MSGAWQIIVVLAVLIITEAIFFLLIGDQHE
jgi:hypothetical protein